MATRSKSKSKKKTKKSTARSNRLSSVYVFALALLLGALTYIPGQAVWTVVRNVCFGLFGWVMYLVAPLTLYVAVLIAAQRNWRGKLALGFGLLLMLCGIALVFTKYEPGEASFGEMIHSLYQMGLSRQGGGVFAVPLGLSLLCWTGRPAADILLIILLLVLVMIFADVTPADIFNFLHRTASDARDSAADALAEYDTRRSERRAERQALRAEQEAASSEKDTEGAAAEKRTGRRRPRIDPQLPPETPQKPRDRWDIDVEIKEDVQTEPAVVEEAAAAVPLQETRGQAFSPEDYTELSNVLNHDMLVAAGREALKPREDKAAPHAAQPAPHKPLFDQDSSRLPGTGSVFLRTETSSDSAAEGGKVYLADAEEKDGPGGEIDELIRRALDGRPTVEDGLPDDLAPIAAEADDASADVPLETDTAAVLPVPDIAEPVAPAIPAPPPYHLPDVELLDRQPNTDPGNVNSEMRHNAQLLVNTLESFGVHTKILDICRGPSVTRYELQPQAGVKISRITNLADDIALNLAAAGVRIEAPIPGKPAVGIEVPNKVKTTVALRSLIQSDEFDTCKAPLTMCLGRDIAGSVKIADLSKMPHMLIAGSTGSGKSVCINSIIMSFLYKSTPDELRMILIDPKVVELAVYNGIPHLLMPVVTEPRKAAGALGSAVAEMERRYQLFANNNVRDIKSFNHLAEERDGMEKLPYIAIIIDELADLMMVAGKQVEDYICRIAQKARAAGMHLIVATQRPSVDVITGLIKANIPSRIAFAVSSQVDSRTILDGAGAEKLLGMGDMLFLPVGASKPTRIQGTYVKDEEIERVTDEIRSYASSRYDEEMIADADRRAVAAESGGKEAAGDAAEDEEGQDPMLRAAIETVVDAKMASTSLLQRKLKLGYARAARIMDAMETLHVIGPYEGSKPRQVLISREQFLEMTMSMPESEN